MLAASLRTSAWVEAEAAGFELRLRSRLIIAQDKKGLAQLIREVVPGNAISDLVK